MTLSNIFCLDKDEGTYLIEDTIDCPGHPLLTSALAHVASNHDKVYWLSFEACLRTPAGLADVSKNVEIIVPQHRPDLRLDIDELHLNYLASVVRRRDAENVALFVDSLNFLILGSSVSRAVELLSFARQVIGVKCICAMVHVDDMDGELLLELEYFFAAVVRLLPCDATGIYCRYKQTSKKSSGKVVRTDGTIALHDSGRVLVSPHVAPKVVKPAASGAAPVATPEADKEPIPGLPFKLSLTSSQREARANVKLPYLKPAAAAESGALPATSGANIHYEFDEGDDYDDEDPDNDLGF